MSAFSMVLPGHLTGISEASWELLRQLNKWGVQSHSQLYWYAILGEEFGEVGKAICENDHKNLRDELADLAAVAISMIESLDRAGFDGG